MPATLVAALAILFFLLLIGALAARLTRTRNREPDESRPNPPPTFHGWLRVRWAAARRSQRSGAAAIVLLLVGFLVAGSVPPSRLEGSPELARLLVRAGQPRLAERILWPLALSHLDSVSLQREYISTYFEIPPGRRDDRILRTFYERVHDTSSGHRRDVAAYALGLYSLEWGNPRRATEWFGEVRDQRLAHLHNSWGEALRMLGDPAGARQRFWREVENGQAVGAAAANLATDALKAREWAELERLATDPRTRAVVPGHAARVLLLHLHSWGAYFLALTRSFAGAGDPLALVVVLLGAVPWVLIVRAWDVFEEEPIALTLLTVLAGAVSVVAIHAIHDVLALAATTQALDSGLPRSPGAWIVRVGLVEEAVKLLPLAAIALLTRQINEPSDWVIYGGLSALGFALAENYAYAGYAGIGMGFSRTFITVPLHVTFTGLVAVSVPQAGLRGWSAPRTFILAWLVAGAVHGMYDHFVSNGSEFLAVILALGWAAAFTVWHEQVAMLSPFRAAPARRVDRAWGLRLFLYAFGMGAVVFLIYSSRYHPWFAMRLLSWHLYSLIGGACLMVFFSSFSVPAGTVENLRRRLRLRHAGISGA